MIKLAPKAKVHFSNYLENEKGIGIGIQLKKSGCSGFAYHLFVVKNDEQVKDYILCKDDICFYIKENDKNCLNGLIIDVQEKGLSTNVVFVNPNEKNACGCGESVSF
tara:strand:- start:1452 stop:1772 length:321 start_codon:yes stop_codon:yes gene_type:complete